MREIFTRKATETDLDFTYYVKKAALHDYIEKTYGPWKEEWQWEEHKKDFSTGLFEIITADGADAGFTHIRRTEKAIYLVAICILPEHQGKGVGKFLIKKLICEAKALNIPVELGVFKINHSALKLYTTLGFKQISDTPTHILMRC